MADNGTRKYYLPESEMPKVYYNIMAELPEPPPPVLHPATGQPVGPDDIAPLFPMALIMQEVSTEREIEIPSRCARCTAVPSLAAHPRARAGEGARHPGESTTSTRASARLAPQAQHGHRAGLLQPQEGVRKLATETGAGQWGSSLAMACAFFGMECEVFMVRVSYDQKPYRRAMMRSTGRRSTPAPAI